MELGMWWLVPLASFLRICIITLKVEGLKCMSWRCRNQHCLVQQNNILWKVLSVWGHWLDREEFFVICGKKIDRELIHRLKKTQNMEMTRVPKSHFHCSTNMLFAYHFEFMLFIIEILIFLSDFEDRKQWHNLPLFLRKIKVHKINALYLSVKVFSTEVLIGDIIFSSPPGDRTTILCVHPSQMKV